MSQSSSKTAGLSAGHPGAYLRLVRRNARYRRFWLAGVVSQIGDWFNYIGIFVLLTGLTGSGRAVSWFLLAKFLPAFLLGPVAGVLADRFDRKTILIGCDLSRALVVLAYLLVQGREQVWLVYLLAFVQESIWTFFNPARQASVPNLCTAEELNVANGLSGATWSIMLAVGAALGGFVTALAGWKTAVVVDSLTFLLSAGIMATVTLPARHRTEHPRSSLRLAELFGLRDLYEGAVYVRSHGRVAALLTVKSGWALSGGILVMLTVFGEQVFAENGQGGLSGVFYSMRGLGAAVGPMLAWRLFGDSEQSMRRAIGAAFFISSAAYLLFSRTETIIAAAACVFLGHVGGSIQWVFSTTLLQRRVEDGFRGRVFAAEMGLLTLVLSCSTWATGLALDLGWSPRTIVAVLAVLFLLPGSVWVVYLFSIPDRD